MHFGAFRSSHKFLALGKSFGRNAISGAGRELIKPLWSGQPNGGAAERVGDKHNHVATPFLLALRFSPEVNLYQRASSSQYRAVSILRPDDGARLTCRRQTHPDPARRLQLIENARWCRFSLSSSDRSPRATRLTLPPRARAPPQSRSRKAPSRARRECQHQLPGSSRQQKPSAVLPKPNPVYQTMHIQTSQIATEVVAAGVIEIARSPKLSACEIFPRRTSGSSTQP